MNKLTNFVTFVFLGVLALSQTAAMAFAQSYSQASNKYNITIDKKIRPISSTVYFDNIASKVKIFQERDQIDYQLTIENTGNTVLNEIEVKDSLPKYFIPSLFPGNYDKESGQIKVMINTLNIGETKVINIRGMLANLPASDYSSQLIKLTNKAEAYSEKAYDSDYASIFAEKRVNPVTGSETVIIGSITTILALIISFYLRKQVRGY